MREDCTYALGYVGEERHFRKTKLLFSASALSSTGLAFESVAFDSATPEFPVSAALESTFSAESCVFLLLGSILHYRRKGWPIGGGVTTFSQTIELPLWHPPTFDLELPTLAFLYYSHFECSILSQCYRLCTIPPPLYIFLLISPIFLIYPTNQSHKQAVHPFKVSHSISHSVSYSPTEPTSPFTSSSSREFLPSTTNKTVGKYTKFLIIINSFL